MAESETIQLSSEYDGADILLVEPFYCGSHRQLIDCLMSDPCIKGRAHLVTMTGKKWHWRARVSALHLSTAIPVDPNYKVLFTSSVLNLAELVALRSDLSGLHKIVYFHENQLQYPVRKHQNRDFQYGYNQILSCLVADCVLFNSHFNMESFLTSINSFMKLMPDYRPKGLAQVLRPKCSVLYFPMLYRHITHCLSGGDPGRVSVNTLHNTVDRSTDCPTEPADINPAEGGSGTSFEAHREQTDTADCNQGCQNVQTHQEECSHGNHIMQAKQFCCSHFKEEMSAHRSCGCLDNQEEPTLEPHRSDCNHEVRACQADCSHGNREVLGCCQGDQELVSRQANCLPIDKESWVGEGEDKKQDCLHIVWPHRWEHDKDPETFFRTLFQLHKEGLHFTLSVLGETFTDVPEIFAEAKTVLADHICTWGYQTEKSSYYQALQAADVVVSTSKHEFFGVAVLEAVYLGCYPLCPKSLVYPEIYPSECLYSTPTQLYKRLRNFCRHPHVARKSSLQVDVHRFSWDTLRCQYLTKLRMK